MEDRKTELIKRWQYNKDHLFLFAHDELCLKQFIDFNPKLYLITFAVYVATSAILGLFLGLLIKDILGAIKGCLIFFGICFILDRIYSYYLYLNYIKFEYSLMLPIIAFAIAAGIETLFNNVPLTICAFIVVSIILIKICKSVYFEEQNNLYKFLEEKEGEDLSVDRIKADQ